MFKNVKKGTKGGKTMIFKRELFDKYPAMEPFHCELAKLAWEMYEETEKQTRWGRKRLAYAKDYANNFKQYPKK